VVDLAQQSEKTMTEVPNELVLTRLIDAPREKLFRCWTEPSLLKQWFAPAPVTTPVAQADLRIGGANLIVMRMPDGQEIPWTTRSRESDRRRTTGNGMIAPWPSAR
jgi:uncharacterized protein YndB with AHSA1/START domain